MNSKTKKILNISTKVLAWIIIVFAVFMMIFTVISTVSVDKTDQGIFGYKFFIVLTDSMSPSENNADMDVHFSAGDLIIVQDVADKYALKEGDIVSFLSLDGGETHGKTITHMIKKVNNRGGRITYTTFGTNTGAIDQSELDPSYVLGKYVGQINGLGHFLEFMGTVPGYIVCILVPFLILIIYNGVNCIILFKKYKREQNAELENEKAQIKQEREETAEMLKQLQALKAELEAQKQKEKKDDSSSEVDAPVEGDKTTNEQE